MKKNIKRAIAFVCIAALVALLAAMPLIAKQEPEEDGIKASILSNTVSGGSINTELIGGGTLAEEDAVTVAIPSAVKLTKFLVSNGDSVTEGTPIAAVDRVTVMTAISQVQETLEYLSEQIQEAGDTDGEDTVVALAGGIVKILYAEEGDAVQNVMLEHGALAILSLDGLMAVDLEAESTLSAGTVVKVTLSDGTETSGKIIKNLAGEMTVAVEDDNYAVDDKVQVSAEDGTVIGSGVLYIYSPWNATAYAGTVDSIKVSVGDELSAGKTLMELSDVGYSATYRQLIGQRQEYEELMLELFKMYQTETITAPCDGVVSGIDKNSVQLLSANGQGYTINFLANSPNGDDETLYDNYVGKVLAVGENGWSLIVNPNSIEIANYKDLTGVSLDEKTMTWVCIYTAPSSDVPGNQPETVPGQGEAPAPGTGSMPAPSELAVPATVEETQPEETQPEETQPEETQPEGTQPEGTQPEGIQPEGTQPEGTQPEGTNPGLEPVDPPDVPQNNTIPIYELVEGNWQQIPAKTVTAGDVLLFAVDQNGEFVWIVRIKKADNTPSTPSGSGGAGGGLPSGGAGSSYPSGGMSGSYPSNGNWGGSWGGTGGMVEQEPAFELYGLDMAQIATVTPQSTMTLDITVDELDVKALYVGMTAQVKIDALGGEKYTASITEIGNTGTNSGGNSKYTVELTLERAEEMLSGMNAAVTIVLSAVDGVLTIPADALVEQGNQTVVYTGYDEETETLLDPVVVKIGSSDGETVEILEGLANGQTYYYAYYDTLEISFTPEFGSGGFMFG